VTTATGASAAIGLEDAWPIRRQTRNAQAGTRAKSQSCRLPDPSHQLAHRFFACWVNRMGKSMRSFTSANGGHNFEEMGGLGVASPVSDSPTFG